MQLASEGEQLDSNYAGLVHKWMKYRYLAYEKLGDVDNQRQLALRLIYGREFEYYTKLKALYPPVDWPEEVNEILNVFENMPYQPDIYVNILIQEKLWEKLLNYCRQHPENIVSLYKYLQEDYRDEVSQLFRKHIENKARAANQRSQYRRICSLIRDYKKACGAADADRIIADLKHAYARLL